SDTLTGLTANTGTNIVWDNGSQTAAPGTAITPPAPPPASGSATITVTNQQLYGYSSISGPYTAYNGIGNVYAVYEYWNEETEEYEPVGDEIGAVTNGKLSFTLQKAPPAEALGLLTAGMSAGVTVSDKNAKWIIVSFNFSDGSEIYELDCRYLDGPNFNSLVYWYIDKDVSVKGSYNDAGYTFYIDLSLKKGFNAVYQAGTGDSMKMTTAKPADADLLKWIYHNMGL
ncbi:MAG: hypothetical protein FWC06_06740, partial [Treponema sp.]|nr:hypothetical protein [Treponema sp.]